MQIREQARAKINLTLRVLGRRPDGYHALESLVSFAEVADTVVLDVGQPPGVTVTGPFARAIVGDNLLQTTLDAARRLAPSLRVGAVHLTKNLPVAAGIGGGSSDAAALLRALRRANAAAGPAVDWLALASRLGADVPICLHDRPALMTGIGEHLAPLPAEAGASAMPAVLVNPMQPLATAAVFGELGAAALDAGQGVAAPAPRFGSLADALAYMRDIGNDLEAPAQRLLPVVGDIKRALTVQAACLHAAMSGSGPTCFGVFADAQAAEQAADAVHRAEPGWWVVATRIASPAGA